jgi:hypothetical protein
MYTNGFFVMGIIPSLGEKRIAPIMQAGAGAQDRVFSLLIGLVKIQKYKFNKIENTKYRG